MEFAFVAWAVLALLIGAWASGIGRSGFGWFVLALIISPLLAGIALLIAGRRNESSGPTKKCPDCSEPVARDARACKHCGYRFLPPETPEEAAAREQAAEAALQKRRMLAVVIVAVIIYVIYNGNT